MRILINRKRVHVIWILINLFFIAEAQVSSIIVGKRYQDYKDSIQHVEYAYVFPVWGEKAREAGVDLQKPLGIMAGWYGQKQNLTISELSIGIRDSEELVNIDDFTDFEYITTKNSVYTIRPDFWLFPFLNIYGIASVFSAYTDAMLSVPFELDIPPVEKTGYGGGFGTVLAYGWGPIWASGNLNMAWSKTPGLEKPTQSIVSSLRIGTSYYTKNRKRSGSIWVGTTYQNYVGSNTGTYDMTQLIPDDKPRLDELLEKVEAFQEELSGRYEDYCDQPGNGLTCIVIDQVVDEFKAAIEQKIDGFEPPELMLNFGYEVSPEKKWNLNTGIQVNISKSWEARFEAGLLGRRSFLFNLNYRFGIIRKNARPDNG